MVEHVIEILGGDWLYRAVLGATAGGVIFLVLGIRHLAHGGGVDPFEQRLIRAVKGPAVEEPRAQTAGRRGRSALAPIAKVATPTDERELGRLRAKLAHAGLRGERALVHYLAAKVLLGLALAGLFLWFNATRPMETIYALLFTISSMAAGFYLPAFWLGSRVRRRQREINRALPNALDLLVTCVEAGLGLEAAILRVAEEVGLFSLLLAGELNQTSLEMRAGASRGDAFRRLAERTGVEELHSLSAVIVQTQIFGTSIADSLRVQAESMRSRRMNLAEERAVEAGVKMSIPLVLCITPSLFAVLLGPAAVRIYRDLLPVFMGE